MNVSLAILILQLSMSLSVCSYLCLYDINFSKSIGMILYVCSSQPETKQHDDKEEVSEEETSASDSDKSTYDDEESYTGDVITFQGKINSEIISIIEVQIPTLPHWCN